MKIPPAPEFALAKWERERIEAALAFKMSQRKVFGMPTLRWAAGEICEANGLSSAIGSMERELRRLLRPGPKDIAARRHYLSATMRERLEKLLGEPIERVLGRELRVQGGMSFLNKKGMDAAQIVKGMDSVDDEISSAGMATMYDPAHRLSQKERERLIQFDPQTVVLFTAKQPRGKWEIVGYSLQVALKREYFERALMGEYIEHEFNLSHVEKIDEEKPLDIYVFDVVLSPRYIPTDKVGGPGYILVRWLQRELEIWRDSGIIVRRIAGTASSEFGLKLARVFSLQELGKYKDPDAGGTVVGGGP